MSNLLIGRRTRSLSGLAAGVLLAASVGAVSAASSPVAVVPVAAGVIPTSDPVTFRVTAVSVVPAAVMRPTRALAHRTALIARQTAYKDFTLRSRSTRDMRGVERSLYRGRYYRPSVEPTRECIARRESLGFYDVVSPSGSFFGAYQVSRDLARGATWMMLKEHKRLLGKRTAKRVLARLRHQPMNTWPRYWQDAAFYTVMNWEGPRSGAAHWAGGPWRC